MIWSSSTSQFGGMSEFPACSDLFGKVFACLSPKSQMYYYYATGDTESCPEFIQDWMKCLQAQSSASEKKKAAILESTYIMKAQRELDAHRLWELKGKPTW